MRKRMISPDLFSDPDLAELDKRYLYENLPVLAEDSGCLRWDARVISAELFRFDQPIERVEQLMAELALEDRAWPYEERGKAYAYLPEFRVWQRSLTRWSEPAAIPLPPGIIYEPSEVPNQKGSGRYIWPDSKDALAGADLPLSPTQAKEPNAPTPSELKVLESKGPARSPLAARDTCPDCEGTGYKSRDGQPCNWTPECASARADK